MLVTIYNRLKENRFNLSQSQKAELGKIIAQEYFKLPPKNRPFLYKVSSLEIDGTYQVWVYPKRFIEKMDQLIVDYCSQQGIRRSKRSRIVAEKVGSSKR